MLRLQVLELNGAKQRTLEALLQSARGEPEAHPEAPVRCSRTSATSTRCSTWTPCSMRFAETIRQSLGFRIVLLRIREPGTDGLQGARVRRASRAESQAELEEQDIGSRDFLSLARATSSGSAARTSSATSTRSPQPLPGGTSRPGPARGLGVARRGRPAGAALQPHRRARGGYLSVDDPVDRLVPSRETIELLEIFGNHAVVAIENARLVPVSSRARARARGGRTGAWGVHTAQERRSCRPSRTSCAPRYRRSAPTSTA